VIDYTGDARFPAALVPSLMEGGNLVKTDAIKQAEMTAPGSLPASPNPLAYGGENLPGPQPSNADASRPSPLPVNWPPRLGEHADVLPADLGWQGTWMSADGTHPQPWQEV
jgi:hypothetical protein